MPELVAHVPAYAVNHWDELLADVTRSLGRIEDWDKDWKKRAKADRIICLRQAIADCRQDVDAFIALEKSRLDGLRQTMAMPKDCATPVLIAKRSIGFANAADQA
jgi:hypothetical protein